MFKHHFSEKYLISDFGLVEAPDVSIIKDWLSGIYPELDFPQPDFWKPKFSDLNHGAHAAVFFSTTAFDMGVMSIRLVGFEIRDTITWHHGHGTELIVLARKPLEKGLSIAENVLKYGTGGINIDGCRVKTNEDLSKNYNSVRKSDNVMGERGYRMGFRQNKDSFAEATDSTLLGRFPANLILSHHPACTHNGLKKIKAITGGTGEKSMGALGKNGKYGKFALDRLAQNAGGVGDENGQETVEDWTCHENCPIRIMDEQSGESKSILRKPNGKAILNVQKGWNDNSMVDKTIRGFSDTGGASRFFPHLNYTNADTRIPQTLIDWLTKLIG